jgi:hypothetical protein
MSFASFLDSLDILFFRPPSGRHFDSFYDPQSLVFAALQSHFSLTLSLFYLAVDYNFSWPIFKARFDPFFFGIFILCSQFCLAGPEFMANRYVVARGLLQFFVG